ncbi:MAG: hypothetical protein ACOYL5_06770 [Phototrophicaceae bacterium]
MRSLLQRIALLLLLLTPSILQAQEGVEAPSATPASIRLASVTPPPLIASATPFFAISGDTPTPQDVVLIEAFSTANVRSSPDIIDENVIGVIAQGQRYRAIGRYFNWILFQFDLARDGSNRGWVYADLVSVLGDVNAIPEITLDVTPTLEPVIAAQTQTLEAVLTAPGGILTVTAMSRVINPLSQDTANTGITSLDVTAEGQSVLPTFTFPPGFEVAAFPTNAVAAPPNNAVGDFAVGGIPPIVPLALLIGFGLLGLVISARQG